MYNSWPLCLSDRPDSGLFDESRRTPIAAAGSTSSGPVKGQVMNIYPDLILISISGGLEET